MKKIIFASLTLLFIHTAHAAIEILKETPDGIAYVDPDSIAKSNGLTKVIVLQDFHKMQSHTGHSYLTSKVQLGFDCKAKTVQQLEITLFPENMGNGEPVFAEQQASVPSAIKAGSLEAAVMQKVCR
jgi:hypothetical protein